MKITFATPLFTFVSFLYFNRAASNCIHVDMDDGSMYWGYVTSISSSFSWMKTPQVHQGYSVIMNLGNGANRETTVTKYLQYVPRPPHVPSAHHLPDKAKIFDMDDYITRTEFKPYNYDDKEADEVLRIWITIPGSTTVMTAQLEKLDYSPIHAPHEEVMKLWEAENRRRNRNQASTSG